MKKMILLVLTLQCFSLYAPAGKIAEMAFPHFCKGLPTPSKKLVRITPNPTEEGTFEVRSETKYPVHFYVFDLYNNLVFQAILLPGKLQMITTLNPGTYTYDVFRNNDGVEQGIITVQAKKKQTNKQLEN